MAVPLFPGFWALMRGGSVVQHPIPGTTLYPLPIRATGPAGHFPDTVRVEPWVDIGCAEYHPRTLWIGCRAAVTSPGIAQPGPLEGFEFEIPLASNMDGEILVEVQGLHNGSPYWRRFNLAAYQQIGIGIAGFTGIRCRVLRSTLVGFDTLAMLSSDGDGYQREVAIYGASVAGPGRYLTPPGAESMMPQTADAGFLWVALGRVIAGSNGIPAPAVVGVNQPVLGNIFQISAQAASPYRMNWRIRL